MTEENLEPTLEGAPIEVVMELNPDGEGYRLVDPLEADESPDDTTKKQCR